MQTTKEDFTFTAEEIAEAVDTWANFTGFSGETCGECRKTANVLCGPGWLCVCGHYNVQRFHPRHPHPSPDLGPDAEIIGRGYRASERWGGYYLDDNDKAEQK
jgi:hypothetical protein